MHYGEGVEIRTVMKSNLETHFSICRFSSNKIDSLYEAHLNPLQSENIKADKERGEKSKTTDGFFCHKHNMFQIFRLAKCVKFPPPNYNLSPSAMLQIRRGFSC